MKKKKNSHSMNFFVIMLLLSPIVLNNVKLTIKRSISALLISYVESLTNFPTVLEKNESWEICEGFHFVRSFPVRLKKFLNER